MHVLIVSMLYSVRLFSLGRPLKCAYLQLTQKVGFSQGFLPPLDLQSQHLFPVYKSASTSEQPVQLYSSRLRSSAKRIVFLHIPFAASVSDGRHT